MKPSDVDTARFSLLLNDKYEEVNLFWEFMGEQRVERERERHGSWLSLLYSITPLYYV